MLSLPTRREFLAAAATAALAPVTPADEPKDAPAVPPTNWPRWRGPNADGVADNRNLTTKWSKTENVLWSAKLPGWGTSSPVVFGPVALSVQGGSLNRVYAVGDPAANTMNVAVHVIKVPETGSPAPTMVDTGSGGMAVVIQLIARFLHLFRT